MLTTDISDKKPRHTVQYNQWTYLQLEQGKVSQSRQFSKCKFFSFFYKMQIYYSRYMVHSDTQNFTRIKLSIFEVSTLETDDLRHVVNLEGPITQKSQTLIEKYVDIWAYVLTQWKLNYNSKNIFQDLLLEFGYLWRHMRLILLKLCENSSLEWLI